MSVEVMSLVWSHRGLSPTRKLILLRLADHSDTDGKCWPSIAHVADFCECSTRTVARAIAHFEEIGLISHHRRFNQSNVYQFNTDKMSYTPTTKCPIPPVKMSVSDEVIGHQCHINTDTGVLLNHQEPPEIKNKQSAKKVEKQVDEALELDSANTSEGTSLGTKPSWFGFEDINGYALRSEPKDGTLIRNPHTGEITEYEK